MSGQLDAVEHEVARTATRWMEAAERRDRSALERFLADEFTMVTNRGSLIDKPPEFLDVCVRVYGDAALMTSRTILHTTFDGKVWSGEYFLTDVWVRRDGRWQLVRRHSSDVVPGAS